MFKRFTRKHPQKPVSTPPERAFSDTQQPTIKAELQASTGPVFITELSRLPLVSFIAAATRKDFSGIIVSGNPTEAETAAAWEHLQALYIDASAGESQRRELTTQAARHSAFARLERINILLAAAVILEDAAICEALAEEDYHLTLTDDEADMQRQLQLLSTRLKADALRLRVEAGRDKKGGTHEDDEPTGLSEDFFYDVLISVSEVIKAHVSAESLSTLEFCKYLRRLAQEVERNRIHAQKMAQHGK